MIPRPRLHEDVEYYRRRAVQEQLAAGNAASEEARKCHDELAMLYRIKVAMLSTRPDSWAGSLAAKPESQVA